MCQYISMMENNTSAVFKTRTLSAQCSIADQAAGHQISTVLIRQYLRDRNVRNNSLFNERLNSVNERLALVLKLGFCFK